MRNINQFGSQKRRILLRVPLCTASKGTIGIARPRVTGPVVPTSFNQFIVIFIVHLVLFHLYLLAQPAVLFLIIHFNPSSHHITSCCVIFI